MPTNRFRFAVAPCDGAAEPEQPIMSGFGRIRVFSRGHSLKHRKSANCKASRRGTSGVAICPDYASRWFSQRSRRRHLPCRQLGSAAWMESQAARAPSISPFLGIGRQYRATINRVIDIYQFRRCALVPRLAPTIRLATAHLSF